MTRLIVSVEMKPSQMMIGATLQPVVDQTHVLSLRTGQQHVLEVRNAMDTVPGHVVIYGYQNTVNVTVERNNLCILIGGGMMVNSVVP